MESFGDYAYYYDVFYRDKDYRREAEDVHKLLSEYGIHEVLNFGCGTGRHDLELSKLGYHCQGIDISSSMIETAKRNALLAGVSIDFSVQDIRNFRAESEKDAVISLFHVISYQNENEDVLNAFRSARASLKKGGIFLFDVWYGPGVLSDKPCVRVKEVEEGRSRLIRIARPVMDDKKNIVSVHYDILAIDKETSKVREITEIHNMRYFFRPELKILLSEAGFELINNIDCLSLGETDFSSWTSYFIARAV